jgi:hypothetical protein
MPLSIIEEKGILSEKRAFDGPTSPFAAAGGVRDHRLL